MVAGESSWGSWLDRLYNLRRDKTGTYERPHKPALLLAIIDLMDRGVIAGNRVPFSAELESTFKLFFDVVRRHNDRPSIENPFYYLTGDKFWHLTPQPGGAPTRAELRRQAICGSFDKGLWSLLDSPGSRHQIREALIARYFADDRDKLAAVTAAGRDTSRSKDADAKLPPGRDAAFRKTILEIYDYHCAACGIRVLLEHRESLAEAAHLVPFSISRNDNPTNGLALCPNHHWAMDRYLIAPCPDAKSEVGVWRANERRLDTRLEGQRELVAIGGKPVIAPRERMFYPSAEGMRWREQHLDSSGMKQA